MKVPSLVLADFLKWMYPKGDDGLLKVSSDMFGRLVIAHCRTSDRPVPSPEEDDDLVLDLSLPKTRASQHLDNKFLYFTPGDTASLGAALTACFDIDFSLYYRKGTELGLRKKDIIDAYILSRGLFSADCFDALHKRIYRRDQAVLERLSRKLVRKAYYIDESIDCKGLAGYDKIDR
ncbi:MAG: hypothetical protein ACI3ZT_01745 [Candidatus Cryptobacteroides sp.]